MSSEPGRDVVRGRHAMPAQRRTLRLADVLTLAITDVACLGAGTGVGWLLDGVAESRPLLTLFGFLVGLVLASVVTWTQVRKFLTGTA